MYIRLQISDVWFVFIKEKEMPSICAEYVVKVSVFVIFYFFLVWNTFQILLFSSLENRHRSLPSIQYTATYSSRKRVLLQNDFQTGKCETRLYVFVRMKTNLETKLFKNEFSSNTNPIWPDIVAFPDSSVKCGGKSISEWNLRGLSKQHLFVRSFGYRELGETISCEQSRLLLVFTYYVINE